MVYAVIMAGGRGERFWPRSRQHKPKQFLPLLEDRTLLQMTVDRIKPVIPTERIYVVANQEHEGLVREQLPELSPENILLEPMGRNTAACIALAAACILGRGAARDEGEDPILAILPSDHLIKDEADFAGTLRAGANLAVRSGRVVTLGITPHYPETGFGYIEMAEEEIPSPPKKARKVRRFVEKPDRARAEEYLAAGNFLWNSGIFIWEASRILTMFAEHLPEMMPGLEALLESFQTARREAAAASDEVARVYASWPSVSVDKGIMEKTGEIMVIPCRFGWDDVGSWPSLTRLKPADDQGNLLEGNVVAVDTRNSLISSQTKLIATLGVENLVIVEDDGVLLVCHKNRAQDIGKVLKKLKEEGKGKYL